jgi:Zn-dependent peptidase ImmA (M78 family)
MNLRQVRMLAEDLADERSNNAFPVNVEAIARSLGLNVVEADLGPDVSGLLVFNGAKGEVYIHKKDPEVRRRFTIAHEIGHHYLRHQFESGTHVHVDRGNYISQRGPRSSDGIDPKEVEANQFAASLLMPSKMLRARIAKIPKAKPLLDHHVSLLARDFKVSEQAMTIRLTALGLL